MAPTRAQIEDQWGKAVRVLNELRKFAGTHTYYGAGLQPSIDVTRNYLNLESDLVGVLNGTYSKEKLDAVLAYRSNLAAAINNGAALLYPHLREYGAFIGAPETDAQSLMTRLYQYMIDNALRVNSRAFSFGTVTAGGSNTGTGTINRLNVDEYNLNIEHQSGISTGLLKTAECISDKSSGANVGEEEFYFYGPAADRDDLKIIGIRGTKVLKNLAFADSSQYLSNPSFESHNGTDAAAFTAGMALTGWTPTTNITNFTPIASDYYRTYQGCQTPRCVSFNSNDTLTQALSTINARLDPSRPMYLQIAYRRMSSCDGTLTLTLGSQTASKVLTTAGSGWEVLRLGPSTSNWFRVWNQTNPAIAITLGGRTTGNVYVDDVIFAPFQNWDGGWYAPVGGATAALRKDKYTWTDTVPVSEGLIQHWCYRAFGRYLPAAATGETWADPS
jgi:hypothetical protein